MPIRLLIADRHPIVRYGLRRLVETEPDVLVVGEAADGREAVRLVEQLRPDALLLDLDLPQFSGIEVLRKLLAVQGNVRIIVMAASREKVDIVNALQLGVRGVLWKDAALDLIPKSLRRVMRGELWMGRHVVSDLAYVLKELFTEAPDGRRRTNGDGLTSQEFEVLAAVAAGLSNRRIAKQLGLSEDTIKHRLTRMFRKLGVTNRLELLLFAVHRLPDPQSHQGVVPFESNAHPHLTDVLESPLLPAAVAEGAIRGSRSEADSVAPATSCAALR